MLIYFVMNRYLIKTVNGSLKIVYGNYLKAVGQSVKGSKVKLIPCHVCDDDIIYGRVSYDELK